MAKTDSTNPIRFTSCALSGGKVMLARAGHSEDEDAFRSLAVLSADEARLLAGELLAAAEIAGPRGDSFEKLDKPKPRSDHFAGVANPSDREIDLTPCNAPVDRAKLVVLNKDATSRDMIVLASYLSRQTAEIVDNWPAEKAMPLALFDGVEQLEAILCSLEHSTRDQKSAASA
jgi:hypothetical protein